MNRIFTRPASHLRHIRRTLTTHNNNSDKKSIIIAADEPQQLVNVLWRYQILDPSGDIINWWNHFFLVTCLVSLFIDPLHFYLPHVGGPACMSTDNSASKAITFCRTFADLFYLLHILMKFRTSFVAPSSRVFGRGELVMDAREIAMRYLKTDFIVDVAATLPLPQARSPLLSLSVGFQCQRIPF